MVVTTSPYLPAASRNSSANGLKMPVTRGSTELLRSATPGQDSGQHWSSKLSRSHPRRSGLVLGSLRSSDQPRVPIETDAGGNDRVTSASPFAEVA
jgi:hypothetical protein